MIWTTFRGGVYRCGCCRCGVRIGRNADDPLAERVALKGYAPISYFTDGKPERGSKDFTFTFAYDDTIYWFKSAAHRDKFETDPEHYAPQFDGYCAVQLSHGLKVEADLEAWVITKGKLYVLAKKPAVQKFASESNAVIEQANQNWPQVRKQ